MSEPIAYNRVPSDGALFVPGLPAPQGSKDYKGKNARGKAILVESATGVHDWRARIAWTAHERGWRPTRDPFAASLEFVLHRPQRTPVATPAAVKRPDADKLARAVLDALTGVAWVDDSQVVDLRSRKRLAEPGEATGVHITLDRLEG
ncbi:RusA family crossover junction endodeoxyribonuclease [Nocardia arizonensis]|uniref:RusA family crossover junction endodeoxyribonuclease n=1 Tax=Nocardia arizonensis TaxID=1141647 RepID=UPI0006D16934|nr:RusA family crossover junction endodeoxyribonuclease [Nocardia arizonensis]